MSSAVVSPLRVRIRMEWSVVVCLRVFDEWRTGLDRTSNVRWSVTIGLFPPQPPAGIKRFALKSILFLKRASATLGRGWGDGRLEPINEFSNCTLFMSVRKWCSFSVSGLYLQSTKRKACHSSSWYVTPPPNTVQAPNNKIHTSDRWSPGLPLTQIQSTVAGTK